ncbi:MAG: ester cyclase [Dehalococcoidia bacterium]
MSEDNKALVRRLVEEVWNAGNLAALEEMIAPDYVHHSAPPEVSRGPQGYRQRVVMDRRPFRDFHLNLEDLISEGDRVVGRWTIQGIHYGEYLGIAPTGRKITFTGIFIVRVAGGKLAEEWEEVDAIGLRQQLTATTTSEQ